MYTTLISTSDLAEHLGDPDWAIVDCRFALADPERGRREYERAHIPGAVYAHLDEDLSGPIVRGKTGRHPLPDVDTLAQTFSALGIDASTQVVAYDDLGGALAAARLWWLLRWLGHEAVAVLDGGWVRWHKEDRMWRAGHEVREARVFTPRIRSEMLVDAADLLARQGDARYKLFDSRSVDRYRGENESIDPVAGHIRGAYSAPYAHNLDQDGNFRTAGELRERFETLLGDTPVEQAAFYCGSGVTAAHNVLALAHAGLGNAQLYAGSWSEWINDPERPVATGDVA